jgi:hypothetical protein
MREDIQLSFVECQMSRTPYQLERFVVGQHDTPEMKFVQVCREIEALYYTIKEVGMANKKTELEIAKLRATGDEIDAIDADIKELGLERTRLVAIGARRELDCLIEMYDAIPHFTRQQIDESQPDYWQARLGTTSQLADHVRRSNWAHLEALDQVGVLQPMIQAQQDERKNCSNEVRDLDYQTT